MVLYKSKLIKAYDFTQVDFSQKIDAFEIDEECLKHDLQQEQKKHMQKQEVEEIALGDYVVINSKASNPKYQKNQITIIVGRGLFNKQLELALVGLKLNSKQMIKLDDDTIEVEIIRITRRCLPSLNDEEIQSWNIDAIFSYEDLKNSLIDKQYQDYLEEMTTQLSAYVEYWALNKSEFVLDDQEEINTRSNGKEFAIEFMKSNGLDVDNMQDDDIWEDLQVTKAQYIEYVENLYLNDLKAALIGYQMIETNGENIENITNEQCVDYYLDQIEKYIMNKLQEEKR